MTENTAVQETKIGERFQVVIAKDIRETLSLKKGQKVVEVARNGNIILVPIFQPWELKGKLKIRSAKTTQGIMHEIDKSWE